MPGLEILNLFIGMVFIYFIFSIVCTVILEIIANVMSLRAKNLESWLLETYGKDGLGAKLMKHRIIDGLTRSGKIASYVPAEHFVNALFDIVHREKKAVDDKNLPAYDAASLKEAVQKSDLLDSDTKTFILQSIQDSKDDLDLARKKVEGWYNHAMDRLAGGYKKKAQKILLPVGIVVAIVSNADSISLIRYLADNPSAATSLADAAEKAVKDSILYKQNESRLKHLEAMQTDGVADSLQKEEIDSSHKAIAEITKSVRYNDSLIHTLKSMHLPIGWDLKDTECEVICKMLRCNGISSPCVYKLPVLRAGETWPAKILGLLLTGLMLTLGAPFWFDTLNKVANLRSGGNKPAVEGEKATTT